MSLSKFTKLGKRKEEGVSHVSTLHSHSKSDNEGFELVRQNGQIMMQGQSSKTVKGPTLNGGDPRVAKFNPLDPVLNDFPLCAPSYETSLDQEDDIEHCPNFHPANLPCSKDLPSVTELNKLRSSENFPLSRSRNLDITKSQSGIAKDSTTSKMHDAGKASNNSGLVNFPHFSQFASIPMANSVKLTPNPLPPKQSEAICMKDGKNDTFVDQSLDKAVASGEKAPEPAMAASSACSANGFDGASDDPSFRLKRKSLETGDSESCSDEFEEESIAFKKANRGRKGSKRSRPSEVHNSSERGRRERINEKMRALQDLLPNCNKVDKASMLDDAIEYLKVLQLQAQFFSMRAGMCMPPVMLPTTMQAIQAMHRAHVPQFLPMGIGMGMGFGMGMNDLNYSMAQMPNTQGPCYPVSQVATSSTFHGAEGSSHRDLAHHPQELPISTPCAPLPSSESPHTSLPGVVHPPHLVPSATSREVVENIGSRAIPNDQSSKSSQDSDSD